MTLLLLAIVAGALLAALIVVCAVVVGGRAPEPKGELLHAAEWRDELARADARTGVQR